MPFDKSEPHIKSFLTAESPLHRYIGIAASTIHRHDPGHFLDDAAFDPFPLLKARALRAYGELGRNSKVDHSNLQSYFTAEDDDVRFSAAWSAALAGDQDAVEVLKLFIMRQSSFSEKALNLTLRRMERNSALSFHKELSISPDTIPLAVIGAGIIGDTVLVPWLLEQMRNADLARAAGEAFSMITGVDIAVAEMEDARPEGYDAGPNDAPEDCNVAMDPHEDLPWPDFEQTTAWWNKTKGSYQNGVRHLHGKPITEGHLQYVLKTCGHRNRAAAALELAMMKPGQPLYEVRAPASRQAREA